MVSVKVSGITSLTVVLPFEPASSSKCIGDCVDSPLIFCDFSIARGVPGDSANKAEIASDEDALPVLGSSNGLIGGPLINVCELGVLRT